MESFTKRNAYYKIGGFNVQDYPIADEGEIKRKSEEFIESNTHHLNPKNRSPFIEIFEGLYKNQLGLVELNERYKSLRKEIEIAINTDNEQIQYTAFKAWGTTQRSPMELGYCSSSEALGIDILKIYESCQSATLADELNFLYPVFNERHQKINFDLAKEYEEKIKTKSYSAEDELKHYEALCLYHFTIASVLGHAPSSYELAKIYKENQLVPPENLCT